MTPIDTSIRWQTRWQSPTVCTAPVLSISMCDISPGPLESSNRRTGSPSECVFRGQVEFAVRQAGVQCSSNPKAKRLFAASKSGGADQLSVCEGEPLFSAKRCKGNNYSSVDSVRNPIACLSSLNGFSLFPAQGGSPPASRTRVENQNGFRI